MESFKHQSQFSNLIIIKSENRRHAVATHLEPNVVSVVQLGLADLRGLIGGAELIYLNLREEPIIYLNDIPYVLRSKNAPYENLTYYKNIDRGNIEAIEENIKGAILDEMGVDGIVGVYDVYSGPAIVKESVAVRDVCTVRDVFEKYFGHVHYLRVPISSYECGLENGSIDNLITLFAGHSSQSKIILNAQDNELRSIFVYVIFKLITIGCKIEQKGVRSLPKHLLEKYGDNETKMYVLNAVLNGNFRIVNNLCYILNDKKSKRIVDDHLGAININFDMRFLLIKRFLERGLLNEELDIKCGTEVIMLKRYIILIIFCDYLSSGENRPFKEYFQTRFEYINLFRFINRKQGSLSLIYPLNIFPDGCGSLNNKTIGDLYTILIKQEIFISEMALGNAIENKEIFINLREEPIVFVNDTPYILKDFVKYTKNITFLRTLKRRKLEEIESIIKLNLCKEIAESGCISVHEIKNDSLSNLIIRNLTAESIRTPKEYFTGHNASILYIRLPITSSVPFRFNLIDKIYKIHGKLNVKGDPCRMLRLFASSGRGRSAYIQIIFDVMCGITKSAPKSVSYKNEVFIILNKIIENGENSYSHALLLFERYFKVSFLDFLMSEQRIKKQVRTIKKFFILVCFIDYHQEIQKTSTFEKWIMGRSDILHLYKKINIATLSMQSENRKEDEREVIARSGSILNGKMILKNDYFVGSRFFNEFDHIRGTRNFRIITSDKNDMFIGLAMPRKIGIENTLKEIEKHHSGNIHWFCLREEPVIYVNERPYVLRNIDKEYENLVIRGISTKVIEKLEDKLKSDIKMDEELLLHTECEISNKISTVLFKTRVSSVRTLKDEFSLYGNIIYNRIPMTDERIPLPVTIDKLLGCLKRVSDPKIVIFNCQIGRGRTTTGLIIAYLFFNHKTLKGKAYESDLRIVSSLLHILPNAIRSKAIADEVIDLMDHLENLRVAYTKYLGINSVRAKDLIVRYLYLICFAEFLLQEKEVGFVEFVQNRNELQALFQHLEADDIDGFL